MSQDLADLQVVPISEALAGRRVDVVVCGSIGAVESVRFVRALRRLGAEVTVWLTKGGAAFVTPTALAWASARPVREGFAGDVSHLATGDAVVVAPASAAMIARIAQGLTDTAAAALVQSYLGQAKPVLVLPNMHESLAAAPAVRRNFDLLPGMGVAVLGAREEEGKRKFPDPATLADLCAHKLNGHRRDERVLITMGTTRGYLDDVRYVSNYSSGALGTLVAEELYRRGLSTFVVCGPAKIEPRVATRHVAVETNDEMAEAVQKAQASGVDAAVLAASVLDFVPKARAAGKISSSAHETLTIELTRAAKIIASVRPTGGVKVGFKLEPALDAARVAELSKRYVGDYGLSLMVLNVLADVGPSKHVAQLVENGAVRSVSGKAEVALAIAAHVADRLAAGVTRS